MKDKIKIINTSWGGATYVNDYFLSNGTIYTGTLDEVLRHLKKINQQQ